ncbi:hypothetical protein DWB85_09365 [Seongchinamella sediminis]|uniref:Lipopolysaccharide kinase (Kdo/WaaP) family protein n=1 Tax=Seongchinamella sediminis TaxID=2283635 RepID=A0A3L7E1W0_9GAMM|nr:lipopolysaccharide kinase InaA family protein [Seongchinamella sediminis]RLQ22132.1 hypothetical protein DWB85_09365 [Seongchinamella sediminis]
MSETLVSEQDYAALAGILGRHELPQGWRLVGSSAYARVAVDEAAGVYYKEFLPRSPLERLKALFKGSRATRARVQNEALREAGFAAPVNLAWGSLPGGREYLFSSAVPGKGVTHWLREELVSREGDSLSRRRQLLRQLGDFIGRLHAAGFTHGDLRTSNVLAEREGEVFHFYLIDNERNRRSTPAAGKEVLRNLMQLNMLRPGDLSHRDRMRFFQCWRRQMPQLNEAEAKLLTRESWRWAHQRLRKKGLV